MTTPESGGVRTLADHLLPPAFAGDPLGLHAALTTAGIIDPNTRSVRMLAASTGPAHFDAAEAAALVDALLALGEFVHVCQQPAASDAAKHVAWRRACDARHVLRALVARADLRDAFGHVDAAFETALEPRRCMYAAGRAHPTGPSYGGLAAAAAAGDARWLYAEVGANHAADGRSDPREIQADVALFLEMHAIARDRDAAAAGSPEAAAAEARYADVMARHHANLRARGQGALVDPPGDLAAVAATFEPVVALVAARDVDGVAAFLRGLIGLTPEQPGAELFDWGAGLLVGSFALFDADAAGAAELPALAAAVVAGDAADILAALPPWLAARGLPALASDAVAPLAAWWIATRALLDGAADGAALQAATLRGAELGLALMANVPAADRAAWDAALGLPAIATA